MGGTEERGSVQWKREGFDDEIELVDYFRVIWKWKYLVIIGALVGGLAAGVVTFNMSKSPPLYCVRQMLELGGGDVGKDSKKVFVYSAEQIKAVIEDGNLNEQISQNMGRSGNKVEASSLKFRVSTVGFGDAVEIAYETPVIEKGVNVLNGLTATLVAYSNKEVESLRAKDFEKIQQGKAEIGRLKGEERFANMKKDNIERRIRELSEAIEESELEAIALKKKREGISRKSGHDESEFGSLYDRLVFENDHLIAKFEEQRFRNVVKRVDAEMVSWKIGNEVKKKSDELRLLEGKKYVEVIRLIGEPTALLLPQGKPRTKSIVVLAALAGFFLMVFFAFFLEYVAKVRKRGPMGPVG